MTIKATSTGSIKRELIPAGSYPARCYSMIHIGTNTENIMGTEKTLNKVRITWELPTETRVFNEEKGEQPFSISNEYTLSMHEKSNLRKDLEGWRGKGFTEEQAREFDISKLIGIPCMLSIIHKTAKSGNDFACINSISKLPKGVECPDQVNPSFEFNYTDKFSESEVMQMPDFIKEKIKSSEEYRALQTDTDPDENEEIFQESDESPF